MFKTKQTWYGKLQVSFHCGPYVQTKKEHENYFLHNILHKLILVKKPLDNVYQQSKDASNNKNKEQDAYIFKNIVWLIALKS